MKKITLTAAVILMAIMGANAQLQTAWLTSGNSASNHSFLGTTNNYPLRVITRDTTRMFISTTGNVGIGTTLPQQMLHIVSGNVLISKTSTNRAPGSTNGSLFFGSVINSTNQFGEWGIEYLSEGNLEHGLNFWKPATAMGGGGNYFLFLKDNGNIGIGTNNPQAKLAVNGEILAKSVRVNTSSTYWPDYVFGNDYNLMSLKELEQYVNTHRHLPNVPSAKEIEEKGDVNLGTMNAILLEKVEELTRYVIDLQHQIEELKKGKE